ncbi:MAG: hypothetical protein RJB38_2293 [Pseudomonadota bacterium]|jgi:hypothetical protein
MIAFRGHDTLKTMTSLARASAAERWREFQSEPFRPLQEDCIPDALIPLYGTSRFTLLSEQEKKALYFGFIQFTAEFFILLESLLLVAMKSVGPHEKGRRLAREELLHSQAFRRFLRQEKRLSFNSGSLMLRRGRWLRKAALVLVRRVPLAMTLPGAKIEAYSVFYGRYLKTHYGSIDANTWMKLNWLHLLDEVHHVPFEFEIHNEVFDELPTVRKVESILGIAIFYAFLQWILISSSLMLGWRSLDHAPLGRKVLLSLATLRWISRSFLPTRQMREAMKAHFRTLRPRGGFWIRYVSR